MTLNVNRFSRRLSWRGVLAGLVMGLVTTFTLIALGTVITALTGLTLSGVGIAAGIWSGLAALAGAYAAGLTAVRASAPATHNDDGLAAMTQEDATMTGLVTGGLIILLSSMFALNTASRVIGGAAQVATNVAGAAATATGGLLTGVAGAAGATGTAAAQVPGIQNFFDNINRDDVAQLIAENNADLNKAQVEATADVVTGIFRRAAYDLGQQDITNVTDFATARYNSIKRALSGDQFVTRLQREGLSAAQAREVQQEMSTTVNRYEEQAKATAARAQALADDALKAAEETARRTASNAALAWLLASGLTLLASVFGAKSAATNLRPVTPVGVTPDGRTVTDRTNNRS